MNNNYYNQPQEGNNFNNYNQSAGNLHQQNQSSSYGNGGNKRNHREVAAAPKNPHVEGPVPASRTLFIRNVQFETTEQEVKERAEEFGDIKTIFNLIAKRGLIFITYYDLRAAENAMASMQNIQFKGRKADVHYSIPKEGDSPEKSQASVLVRLVGSSEALVTHSLYEFMSKFGEIRSVRDQENSDRKIVSFWDSRASGRALDALLSNNSFLDGQLESELFWDEGHESFADKVKSDHGGGGGGGSRRDAGGMRGGNRGGGGRYRDRSRSPDNRRGSDSRDNYRDRDNRRNDRDRDDRRGGNRDRYSRNDNYRAPTPQGQPANLMDILSNSKSILQPTVPQYSSGYGGGVQAGNVYQQQQPQGAPVGGDTNALLASLLSQTNPQQLISILSQLNPQQQQQQQGYSQAPLMPPQQPNFGGYSQNSFPPVAQNLDPRQNFQQYPNSNQLPNFNQAPQYSSTLSSQGPALSDPRLSNNQQQQQPVVGDPRIQSGPSSPKRVPFNPSMFKQAGASNVQSGSAAPNLQALANILMQSKK